MRGNTDLTLISAQCSLKKLLFYLWDTKSLLKLNIQMYIWFVSAIGPFFKPRKSNSGGQIFDPQLFNNSLIFILKKILAIQTYSDIFRHIQTYPDIFRHIQPSGHLSNFHWKRLFDGTIHINLDFLFKKCPPRTKIAIY